MITAAQARQNAVESAQQLQKWLALLEPRIIEASKRGERSTYFFHDDIGSGVMGSNHPYWIRVCAALKELGYTTSDGEVKVGGGLGDLDHDPDNPRMMSVVRVSW